MDLKVFNLRIKFLKVLGIWLTKDSSWIEFIYGLIMQLIFVYIFTIFLGLYIIQVRDLIDFADQMSSFLTYVMCSVKCINIFIKMESLLNLLHDLKNCIEKYKMDKKIIKHVDFAFFILKLYWAATFLTVFIAGFLPFVSDRLAYPMWFPFDLKNSFVYYLAAIYQWIGTICYSTANVSMDMLPVLFISYLIALLYHLCDKLDEMQKYKLEKVGIYLKKVENFENTKKLINCVNCQREIIKLTRKTQEIFSSIIFVQGFFSSIILCTSAYALTKLNLPEDILLFVKFTTYMMAMTTQIAIPCYYGTLLSSAYDKVSESLFHSDWIFEDMKHQKNVKLFMENSKQTFKFKAFKMFEIDLETFMKIINSAYSLFAVFNRVN